MRKALAVLVSGLVALGITVAISTGPAAAKPGPPTAAPGQINCTLHLTLTFSPPLTDTGGGTNPTVVSGKFRGCTEPSPIVKGGVGKLTGTVGTSAPPLSCPGQPSTSSPVNWSATWTATYFTAAENYSAEPSGLSSTGETITNGGGPIGLQLPGTGNAASTTGSFGRSSPDGWSADLSSTVTTSAFDAKCASRAGVEKLNLSGPATVGVSYDFGSPRGMATDGTDVWVANYVDQSQSVTEFNATTGAWVRTIQGLSNPDAVAYGDSHVFAINVFAGTVTEIDASTGAIIGTLSGSPYGFDGPGVEVSDGSHIWFLNTGNNTVTEIDASTGAWIQTLSDPSYDFDQPDGAVFDGTNIWVTNSGNNTVTEIDAATGDLVQVLSGSQYGFDYPGALAFDGTNLWVTNYKHNSVTEVNASSGAWVQTISGRQYGFNDPDAAGSDGQHIWIANFDGNSVTEIDAATGAWIQTQPTGCNGFPGFASAVLFAGSEIWTTTQTFDDHAGDCVDGFDATSGDLIQTLQG
jgi:hypothetical protein